MIEETCPTDVDFGKQKQKGKGPATSFILTNMVKAVFGLAWGGEKEMVCAHTPSKHQSAQLAHMPRLH